ncbi:proton-coupled amino acid transporter-like protein pathetic, partial [Sitodiplosis mosellana]|uniref:proton-coupled amino acid transporter-like protein pathetic n=1 Tax=Sitodiplosis mosellana TaxID=263140 RepID=UPI002444B9A9
MDSKNRLKPVLRATTNDSERASTEFDPFSGRKVEHPTNDYETLAHLMKASLGTGMLSIPYVFKLSGLWFGLILTLVTSFICAHCSYIAVKCAHILYKRIKVSSMTYPEVAEAAFANGPKRVRYLAKTARYFVTICTFITYFGACSVYAVIVGKNTKQMVEYYYPGSEIGIRVSILIFLLPLVLLTSIRNLKFLAPVSILANSCMAAGLSITIYYFVRDLPDIRERPFLNDVSGIPAAIPMTVFAIEAIGVIMPLENQMKKPQNFVGIFGVLNQGMAIVTAVFVILGFFGYWCFGNASEDNIVLNLPVDEKKAQTVKILISCAVLLTFSLTLYPAIEITYNAVKDRFEKKQVMANYIV